MKDENKLYLSLKKMAQSQVFASPVQDVEVYDTNKASNPFLDDMNGHAGTLSFVDDGYGCRFLTVAICHPLCQKT